MANRLQRESSPYLQQHADNPVDWYPWGDEAFQLARETGKPVLLSIGYSACHWCHVMAHESFEDEATAKLMNELFVNIKVDREERPDLDKIYQTAHQLLTQRGGGWPLTMFLDGDDQRPFFGGTYFPKEPRYGMPAFSELLQSVAQYYADRRDDVRSQSAKLVDVFAKLEPATAAADGVLDAAPLAAARATFEQNFDREDGGFGAAPKFPHPTTIDRLLRHWRHSANDAERSKVVATVTTFGDLANSGGALALGVVADAVDYDGMYVVVAGCALLAVALMRSRFMAPVAGLRPLAVAAAEGRRSPAP